MSWGQLALVQQLLLTRTHHFWSRTPPSHKTKNTRSKKRRRRKRSIPGLIQKEHSLSKIRPINPLTKHPNNPLHDTCFQEIILPLYHQIFLNPFQLIWVHFILFLFIPGYSRLLSAVTLLLANGYLCLLSAVVFFISKKGKSRLRSAVGLELTKGGFHSRSVYSLKRPNIATDQEGVHHQPSGKLKGLVWSFGLNNPSIQAQPIPDQL